MYKSTKVAQISQIPEPEAISAANICLEALATNINVSPEAKKELLELV